jgi:homoserine O-acetyltransferase
MIKFSKQCLVAALVAMLLAATPCAAQQPISAAAAEGDFVIHNFQFHSGESLPELRLHYTTLGKPVKDAAGRATNAVLILHGTGGTGQQFFAPQFAGVLFGPGQLLDT